MKRRDFLVSSATVPALAWGRDRGLLATPPGPAPRPTEPPQVMTAAEFHASRRYVDSRFGRIAYVEQGRGPAALFLHGLPLNGFQWRAPMALLSPYRRCLAPDFLGLGYTLMRQGQSQSPVAQADMIDAFLEALQVNEADVVASDSGGAVAQLLVARHPRRVRTLLLTNCDAHTNSPPKSIAGAMDLARKGKLDEVLARHAADKAFARSPEGLFAVCYADPAKLTDEAIDCYLTPLVISDERRAQLNGYLVAFEPNPLPAIAPVLAKSRVPVRIVWGMADIHFDATWADWLDRTFPESRGVRRVEGAKLFFPEEEPRIVADEALALWG